MQKHILCSFVLCLYTIVVETAVDAVAKVVSVVAVTVPEVFFFLLLLPVVIVLAAAVIL